MLQRINTAFSVDAKGEIDSSSRLVMDAPMPGRYHLIVFSAPFVPRIEQEVEVPDGEVPPVVVRVPAGGRLSGVLVDTAGAPIEKARVRVEGGSGDETTTDAEGRFEVPWAPSGPRGVRARLDGSWVAVGRVDVPAGGSVTARLAVPGSGSIAGRLLVGGKPPATAWYAVVSLHDAATARQVADVNPDAYGRFRFPWLAPGTYEVRAWNDQARPESRSVTVGDDEQDVGDIDLSPYHRVPLRLVAPAGTTLPPTTGVSLLLPDGSAPPPIEAGTARWGHSVRLTTDPDGSTWASGIPDGRWRLRIFAQGLAPAEVEFTVPAVETAPIEVRFDRAR
jgi:hypothetical protein